ncbi:SRPBCC family protein [Brevibacterium litoralis]|uniref:SRPBCC family protein n=1 Tax=Brevibacterium litoralis TaxID=3138935 RepID=UPI0032EB4849
MNTPTDTTTSTDTTPQFTITRDFAAPRDLVWQAWTDPTLTVRWWHPHQVTIAPDSVHTDLRVGGTYAYTMVVPGGQEFPTSGSFLEIDPPHRLRFTWGMPGDGETAAPVVTVDLAESGPEACTMTFHLLGVDGDPDHPHSVFRGWSEAFEVLDTLLPDLRAGAVPSQDRS